MLVAMSDRVPAYAVGYLSDVHLNDALFTYMREMDATLEPFGGEFIIHGGELSAVEGQWGGSLVVIRFPDRDAAQRWYESPRYQRILPLRQENSTSMVAIIDGVGPGHTGAGKVEQLIAAVAAGHP